jgi:hypothetical protein
MMTIRAQADQLVDLGLAELAGTSPGALRQLAERLAAGVSSAADGGASAADPILAVHPSLLGPRELMTLVRRVGNPGFVVVDMTDLDEFVPIDGLEVPDSPLYLLQDAARGDEMRNWSPDEALPEISAAGRSPLTISEGISWLLQEPDQLEPNHCFMCIGSRRPKPSGRGGLDARTPALWISGGTGRDGKENRGAPKLGWCWAGNRHTWLGFASTAGRAL